MQVRLWSRRMPFCWVNGQMGLKAMLRAVGACHRCCDVTYLQTCVNKLHFIPKISLGSPELVLLIVSAVE